MLHASSWAMEVSITILPAAPLMGWSQTSFHMTIFNAMELKPPLKHAFILMKIIVWELRDFGSIATLQQVRFKKTFGQKGFSFISFF